MRGDHVRSPFHGSNALTIREPVPEPIRKLKTSYGIFLETAQLSKRKAVQAACNPNGGRLLEVRKVDPRFFRDPNLSSMKKGRRSSKQSSPIHSDPEALFLVRGHRMRCARKQILNQLSTSQCLQNPRRRFDLSRYSESDHARLRSEAYKDSSDGLTQVVTQNQIVPVFGPKQNLRSRLQYLRPCSV